MWRRPDRGAALAVAALSFVAAGLAGCSSGRPSAHTAPSIGAAAGPTPASSTTTATAGPGSTPATESSSPSTTAPTKAGAPALAPSTGTPRLVATPTSGPVGTVVALSASSCPRPDTGYAAFFADSQALAHPQDPSYRHPVAVSASGPDTVSGRYRVTAADSAGYGIFEVLCGSAGNATAPFTVTG